MDRIWKMYTVSKEIIKKLCKNKCYHLGYEKVEACDDYITKRLEKDDFKALKNYDANRGALESTYLHMLISSRLIDFFNSAANKREFSDEVSIDNSHDEIIEPNDHREILDDICSQLKAQEVTFLKYWSDGFSDKEIAAMFTMEAKQVSKKRENIQIKLRKRAKELGYDFKDII